MSAYTYPGVYIQELPSGVHTITGVATSIAAFVGWANMGPTDRAVLVQSWTEFQDQFGGFTSNNGTPNYLGYAVNQFFDNGGSQAYIVRLVVTAAVQTANPSDTLAAKASVSIPLQRRNRVHCNRDRRRAMGQQRLWNSYCCKPHRPDPFLTPRGLHVRGGPGDDC